MVKEVLSKKEMKNVLGGSGGEIDCNGCVFYEKHCDSGAYACKCNGNYVGDANSADCCICYCYS